MRKSLKKLGLGLLATSVALTGCSQSTNSDFANVDTDRILAAAENPAEWLADARLMRFT